MRRALLLALAVLPLAAFDCGGSSPPPPQGGPIHCSLAIRGAVSEDLWCIVSVYDYSRLDPLNKTYLFDLVAYRGTMEVGAEAHLWMTGRPSVNVAYGWDSTGAVAVSNVDWGSTASRWVTTTTPTGPTTAMSHLAEAPSTIDPGSGKLTATFTRLPPVDAPDADLVNVYGALTATVPATPSGGAVTFTATF